MPNYDYICDACKLELTVFQSITEDALKKCPKCRKMKLRRLIGSGAGIIFKGSGFYETDYKRARGGGAPKESKDTAPTPPKESKEPKGDSQPSDAGSKKGSKKKGE